MKRRVAWIILLAVGVGLPSGCHLLLSDDPYESAVGGAGGTAAGGGDSGTGGRDATDLASCIALAPQANGACPVSGDTTSHWPFDSLCEHGNWCAYAPPSTLFLANGRLEIRGERNTGWGDARPSLQTAPTLFRRVEGDFAIRARVGVLGVQEANAAYGVAGFLLRDPAGGTPEAVQPGDGERWISFQYGYLANEYGMLIGESVGGEASERLRQRTSPHDSMSIGLCRTDDVLTFAFDFDDDPNGFVALGTSSTVTEITAQALEVGLTSATYGASVPTGTIGHFDDVVIRTGAAFDEACLAELDAMDYSAK